MALNQKHGWRRRLLKCLGALAVLAVVLGVAAWMFPQQVLTVDSGPVKADAFVVLGGTADRPVRAAELFKAGEAPKIIVSGLGNTVLNEHALERDGVPQTAILLEPKSRTTRENAEFSIALLRQMGAHKVIIVTSWYHSRRALACFEHYAPDMTFYSRPSYFASARAEWRPKGVLGLVRAEYWKLAGYWVRYGVCPL
jgi:uncharacterized SAM-binding protein YcdF (DUF218 family)